MANNYTFPLIVLLASLLLVGGMNEIVILGAMCVGIFDVVWEHVVVFRRLDEN